MHQKRYSPLLGFLLLLIGMWWIVRVFQERPINSLWWLGLIPGILMTVLAFWTPDSSGSTRPILLLVFAGIWALMEGIVNVVRAFEIREVHKEVEPPSRLF